MNAINRKDAASDSPETEAEKLTGGAWVWSEFKFFSGLLVVILAFLTFVWGHFKIPSESMQPTLEVGDHLYVSKYAYGFSKHSLPAILYKLPLPEGRIFAKLPERGDVVVFRNPKSDLVMIKRVVGLPGDRIQTKDGQLYINGTLISRQKFDTRLYRDHKHKRVVSVEVYTQTLPDSEKDFVIYEKNDVSPLDTTALFIVPEDNLFFMGDSRDNSIDSRDQNYGPGPVHINYLIGRADRMMFSFKRCNRDEDLYCPPKGRWMEKL